MNRRRFLRAFVAGTASVAIGLRLANEMPKLVSDDGNYEYKTVSLSYTIVKEESEPGLYATDLGDRYAKALAESMTEKVFR